MNSSQDILSFWFSEIEPANWGKKDPAFDKEIQNRFSLTLAKATACELFDWRNTAQGRLAEVIVLDQFSRNIYRDTPMAFAADPIALVLAQEAVAIKADMELDPVQRNFLYMPYMHSESHAIHEAAVKLFSANKEADNLQFELRHKAIVDRFGRYPHRNAILRRTSTAEEIAFLQEPGSSF